MPAIHELPQRIYYTLDQAAALLNKHYNTDTIDSDYLLHLGATDRAHLVCHCISDKPIYPKMFWLPNENDEDKTRQVHGLLLTPMKNPKREPFFLWINPVDIQRIELTGKSEPSIFRDAYQLNGLRDNYLSFLSNINTTFLRMGYVNSCDYVFFSTTPEKSFHDKHPTKISTEAYQDELERMTAIPITITKSDLLIFSEELDFLMLEEDEYEQVTDGKNDSEHQDPPRVKGTVYPVIKALAEALAKALNKKWTRPHDLNQITLEAFSDFGIDDPTGKRGILDYLTKSSR